jgi:hypothetical protein
MSERMFLFAFSRNCSNSDLSASKSFRSLVRVLLSSSAYRSIPSKRCSRSCSSPSVTLFRGFLNLMCLSRFFVFSLPPNQFGLRNGNNFLHRSGETLRRFRLRFRWLHAETVSRSVFKRECLDLFYGGKFINTFIWDRGEIFMEGGG